MSFKVCYIATLPITLKNFVLESALYNIEHGDWEVFFICDKMPGCEEMFPPNIKFIPITLKRGIHLSGIKSISCLKKIFKREKFDLVQYSTTNASLYASIAARSAKVPVRLYAQWGIGCVYKRGFSRLVHMFVEKKICRKSTFVQPISFENRDIAIKYKMYPSAKSEVVWNGGTGVNVERFDYKNGSLWRKEIREKYGIAETSFLVGFAARFLKDKGMNEFLIASEKLTSFDKNIKILIVGGDDIIEGINLNLLEKARHNHSIFFTGFVNDIEKYFAAMDCFVLPTYHEGFGNVTVEAEAMGVPVIVSDIPGQREAVIKNKTGILIPIKSPENIVTSVMHLYENPSACKAMGQEGIKFVRKCFDQRIMREKVFESLENLMRKKDA